MRSVAMGAAVAEAMLNFQCAYCIGIHSETDEREFMHLIWKMQTNTASLCPKLCSLEKFSDKDLLGVSERERERSWAERTMALYLSLSERIKGKSVLGAQRSVALSRTESKQRNVGGVALLQVDVELFAINFNIGEGALVQRNFLYKSMKLRK